MKPLIITATPNTCWLYPEVEYPKTAEDIIEEAKLCREKGAAVFHIHGEGQWPAVINGVRGASDIIIQCGMSSFTIQERIEVFENRSDMISIILTHHDEAFAEVDCNILHTKEELIEYANICAKYRVRPEFEVWNTGSIWNLNYLIDRGVLEKPYITTLFFGWPGGAWTPPTVEEYLYRKKYMPEGSAMTVSIMHEDQMKLLVSAITHGDNVRVGTEDLPFDRKGRVCATHELVQEIADISRSLGRQVATPDEARDILGIEAV